MCDHIMREEFELAIWKLKRIKAPEIEQNRELLKSVNEKKKYIV